jgi:hypothetical protein
MFLLFSIFYFSRILDPPSTNLNILICPSRYWNSDLYWFQSSTNQNSNLQDILSNLTVLIIHINSTCAVIKINPEIVTGQYNSCVGISKVIFPPPSTNLDILICPSRYWNSDLYWFQSSTNQNPNFY